jgi:DNA helicase IV
VLELAAELAAVAAPGVAAAQPVRGRRDSVRIVSTTPSELPDAVTTEAARLSRSWGSTAVIAAKAHLDPLRDALRAAGLDVGEAAAGRLGHRVTLISAVQAKGLEFDAVVVAEPTAIVDDAARGLRLLYVAVTRPTQALTIVHARDLPDGRRDPHRDSSPPRTHPKQSRGRGSAQGV